MKFFLDTADIQEIKTGISWGIVDGVTTNPSLYAKVGGSYDELLKEICSLTPGPVSAEVISDDTDGMVREGLAFAKIASNIVVKVPMTTAGLAATAGDDPVSAAFLKNLRKVMEREGAGAKVSARASEMLKKSKAFDE